MKITLTREEMRQILARLAGFPDAEVEIVEKHAPSNAAVTHPTLSAIVAEVEGSRSNRFRASNIIRFTLHCNLRHAEFFYDNWDKVKEFICGYNRWPSRSELESHMEGTFKPESKTVLGAPISTKD